MAREIAAPVAVIGAGPAGLSAAKALGDQGIDYIGYDSHSGVGGLWDIANPRSTVYQSAHLISSKRMTEFRDYPMADSAPDYPSHRDLLRYFQGYADQFGLTDRYRFQTAVAGLEPADRGWWLTTAAGERVFHSAVLIANGTLSEPNLPGWPGTFTGEFLHAARYKTADLFEGKRVLIVGAGNSGCDIAVDAVHRARRVALSVRRGYHFVPKYLLGRPADTLGGLLPLPPRLKQRLDSLLLRLAVGDPARFGFPRPDHALYESHPIVNSLVLHHLGHGDLSVVPDVTGFDGRIVRFADGSAEEFDVVLAATGYRLHYPFIDRAHLDWTGAAPALHLNIFPKARDDLFVLGMVEAVGIGWQGRAEQGELVARFLAGLRRGQPAALALARRKRHETPDLTGGYRYLALDRMAYYVHKDTYRRLVRREIEALA